MKIGLISINMYTKGLNFASPLHTYAFQQFLKQHGYESTVIDYQPIYYNGFDLRHPYDYYRALIDERTEQGNTDGIDELLEKMEGYHALYKEREIRHDKFQEFIKKNYIKTNELYNSDLLEVKDPGFDCYICATDVIWKNEPDHGFDRGFFLGSKAMENKWKIAYAASRGVYFSASEEDERRFTYYVEDIDFLSVRERSLQNYLSELIDKPVTTVLDPVLLHDADFYEQIAVKPKETNYLFLYYVMENAKDTIAQAVSYARKHNLKIVEITERPIPNGSLTQYDDIEVIYRYDAGIEEWLGYFMNADVVFTNSFHATCLSILFKKDVFVGARSGDKVTNILDLLGLAQRRLGSHGDVATSTIEPIDYGVVFEKLGEHRKHSADFILQALEYAKTHERPKTNYEWWQREQRYPLVYEIPNDEHGDESLCVSIEYQTKKSVTVRENGDVVYTQEEPSANDGLSRFKPVPVYLADRDLLGWTLRFKIDNDFFVYLEDGSYVLEAEYDALIHGALKVCAPLSRIPYIPVDRIRCMIANPVWGDKTCKTPQMLKLVVNSGAKGCEANEGIVDALQALRPMPKFLQSGSMEFTFDEPIPNDGTFEIPESLFVRDGDAFKGWRVRVKCNGTWYWLMADGVFTHVDSAQKKSAYKLLTSGEKLPFIMSQDAETVVLEAVWTSASVGGVMRRVKRRLGKS